MLNTCDAAGNLAGKTNIETVEASSINYKNIWQAYRI